MHVLEPLYVSAVAERSFTRRLSLPTQTDDGGWLIPFFDEVGAVILDSELNCLQTVDLRIKPEGFVTAEVAINREGQVLAFSMCREIRIVNRDGSLQRSISHRPHERFAGSTCFFDSKNRLWSVQPGGVQDGGNRLTIIEPTTGATLFEQAIPNQHGHFSLFESPDQESALIQVACGQDGSYLYLARLLGNELHVDQYGYGDRAFHGNFSPNGQEFATGAHSGDAVKVHSWPSGDILASATDDQIFAADNLAAHDLVGYQAIFLDDNHLMATTAFGRLLLIDRATMQVLGTVWPVDSKFSGYDNRGKETNDPNTIIDYSSGLSSIHFAGDGKVLVAFDNNVLRLIDVSPLLAA